MSTEVGSPVHNPVSRVTGRLIVGVGLVALGALWTLDNLGIADADAILQWWPILIVAYGVLRITGADGCKRPTMGIVMTVIGSWMLLHTAGLVDVGVFSLWPIALIAAGANIVWRGRQNADGDRSAPPELYPRPFAFMGGNARRYGGHELTGFEASAVMGGVEIDLRDAIARNGTVRAEVFALWGGIDIMVPRNWRVVCEAVPIMGGVDNQALPPIEPVVGTLYVRGVLLMGGLDIKSAGAT